MTHGAPRLASSTRLPLVLLCFFLSGFAALLYETAWLREFACVFGTSELAVVAVLAAYMGGLAAGAAAGGRLAHRVRRPVLVYAALELAIAAFALLVPWAIQAATAVYVWLFGGLAELPEGSGLEGAVFYLAASFVILLPCTGLMGATLPLLVRHAVRREEEIGSRIGLLYASNTAGAIAGTLFAAFVLLPALGLRQTVYCGVAANALVFAAAALLAGRASLPQVAPAPAAGRAAFPERAAWVLPAIGLSGFTSFVYEVLWTRLLGQLLGGSVYAFATMLASFLLGIALGSAVASRLAVDRRRAAAGFASAQLGICLLTLAGFAAVDAVPLLSGWLGAGAKAGLLPNALVSAAVLLPGALCIGATFPFAARVLARDERQAASAAARVYVWNTIGAITGAVTAGFVALPVLGFAGTVQVATSLNAALALLAATAGGLGRGPVLALALAGAVTLVGLRPQEPWALLRSAPWVSNRGTQTAAGDGDVVYFAVGRSATVLLVEENAEWQLRSNGLQEASIQPHGLRTWYGTTERWLTALPLLARPETRSLLVVGLGGGTALEILPAPLESVAVVELEAEIVEASRAIAGRRSPDPLADPRVHVHVGDARGALLLTDARYDGIVSQPSHPWTAGASHLYTREFFQLVRDRLTPEGVFVQWIGLDYVDEALVRTLIATLLDVFPHLEVFLKRGELLFAASSRPFDFIASTPVAVSADPDAFALLGIFGPEEVLAEQVLDGAGARRFCQGAPINSDDFNRIAMRSPRILGNPLGSRGDALFAEWLPLREPEGRAGLDLVYLVRLMFRNLAPARAMALTASIEEPLARESAIANAALYTRRIREGLRRIENALRLDPADHEARAGLLRVRGDAIMRGGPLPPELAAAPGSPSERAVIAGWQDQAKGDWSAVRTGDAALAAVGPRDPLYSSAVRLRVGWRLHSGDPELAREALTLLDRLQAGRSFTSDMLLRSQVALAAGEDDAAMASLAELVAFLAPGQRSLAVRVREVLARLPRDPRREAWRGEIEARLESLAGPG